MVHLKNSDESPVGKTNSNEEQSVENHFDSHDKREVVQLHDAHGKRHKVHRGFIGEQQLLRSMEEGGYHGVEVESERLTNLGDGSAERCDFRQRRHEEVGKHGDGIDDAHEYFFRNAVQPRRNDDGKGRGNVDGLRHGSDAETGDDEEYG